MGIGNAIYKRITVNVDFFVISRSVATKQSDLRGRHKQNEVISSLTGIASLRSQ
jgi:hypothetical protein